MKRFLIAAFMVAAAVLHAAEAIRLDGVENCYRISDDLYRSAQPESAGFSELEQLGVRSVLNLREHHRDMRKARHTKLHLMAYPVAAGEMIAADVENCLALVASAPKPVLVHCWHGSDRTGIVAAAYRIVFQQWSEKMQKRSFAMSDSATTSSGMRIC